MIAGISQHLEHGDVIGLGPGFLENLTGKRNNDCVCGKNDRWLPKFGVVQFRRVDVRCLLGRGLENIFKGGEGLWDVFRQG